MIKTTKLVSVCLVMILLASLFFISGTTAQNIADTNLPNTDDDITGDAENDTLSSTDDDITVDTKPSTYPTTPDRFGYSDATHGQFYGLTGNVVGVYAAQIIYLDPSGTTYNPFFIPSLVVKCNSNLGSYYGIDDMKITATAKFPNGTVVQAWQYDGLEHVLSPDSKVPELERGISKVINVLSSYYPAVSITNDLTWGSSSGGGLLDGWTVTDSKSSSGATSTFHQDWYFAIPPSERGHQFKFNLLCDPQVPGNYVIDVNYEIKLGGAGYSLVSFNQQVIYQYQPTPSKGYASRVDSTFSSGSGANMYQPNWITNYPNGQGATIWATTTGSKAVLNVELLNLQNSYNPVRGHVYIRGFAYVQGSRLLVYASNDNKNWTEILDCNVYTSNNEYQYISCNKNLSWQLNNDFKYLSIVSWNSNGQSSDLNLDAVCIYNY
jgi:hypothetical protein